jgi:hypothetical protein
MKDLLRQWSTIIILKLLIIFEQGPSILIFFLDITNYAPGLTCLHLNSYLLYYIFMFYLPYYLVREFSL